jgi:hydroxymethylbilane synthase
VCGSRALCRRLGGGCKVPVAAFAQIHHGRLTLRGLVANRNGKRILRVQEEGVPEQADLIGTHAGDRLLQQGAAQILREFE